MNLESMAQIQEIWTAEELRHHKKEHPGDFPGLPELPVGRYTRPDFFQLEKELLWPHTWLLVGLADELPSNGRFTRRLINGVPVIVVRGNDQKIRAFYNVCQHRGATLVLEEAGKAHGFVCRYHCWSYGLDGSLKFVPDEHDFPGLDRSKKALRSLRCESYGNLLFVSFDPDIRPLSSHLGGILQVLADVPMDRARLYQTLDYEVACNWKCVHDAFSETYHVKYVHTQSVNLAIDPKCTARHMLRNGHNAMVVKSRGDPATGIVNVFDRQSTADRALVGAHHLNEITRISQRSYNVFPNLTVPIAEGLFPILAVWPISVDRTRMQIHFLKIARPDEDLDTPAARETVAMFGAVVGEDLHALADMQASLASGGISAMPLCYGEQFIYNYHQEIDRVIGRSNIPSDLLTQEVELPLAG